MKIQSRFSEKAVPVVICGPGKTEQSHKDQCDINNIMRDYEQTRLLRHAAKHEGRYDDVPAVDFQQAMILVANAQQMFQELPSGIRNRFRNDPGEFLEFVQTPGNKEELAKMGILRGNDGLDIRGVKTNAPVKDREKTTAEADQENAP